MTVPCIGLTMGAATAEGKAGDFPSDSKCTLTIAGEEEEVVRAATLHAVDVHGHRDTPEFRSQIRGALKDERSAR